MVRAYIPQSSRREQQANTNHVPQASSLIGERVSLTGFMLFTDDDGRMLFTDDNGEMEYTGA